MTFEAMANAARSRFKTQIADAYSLPVQYDNQDYDNPDNTLWCRLSIRFGETAVVEIGGSGGNKYRTQGIMYAQLFAPTGEGDKNILQMAGRINSAFKCVSQSGVNFKTPSIKQVGRLGSEWQVNVVCPFYADTIG